MQEDPRPKLVFYGAGANASEVVIKYRKNKVLQDYNLIGFIDDRKTEEVLGLPILGTRQDLKKLKDEKGIDNIMISLLTDPVRRLQVCLEIEEMGFKFPSCYPSHFDRPYVKIGKGVYIHETSQLIGCNIDIGDFSVFSVYTLIEENAKIGKGVILQPYTFIGIGTEIGDATVFNAKSSCLPINHKVGKECWIGPHVIVHKDLADRTRLLVNRAETLEEKV